MLKRLIPLMAAMMLPGCAQYSDAPAGTVARPAATLRMPPQEHAPEDLQVLFWTAGQRETRFRQMENWFPGYEVPAAKNMRQLERGAGLSPDLKQKIARFMLETNSAGVMILQDGKLQHEAYSLGFDATQRWTSFSVAKSFTSTLLGAAVRDGLIGSLDDSVADYVPELKGTIYEDVTVKQVATMTSGAAWNEDYSDPDSDIAKMAAMVSDTENDALVTQLKTLPREAPPGEKFVYKTIETNLLGAIVENATGMKLAEYAKAKIVDPAGFEASMFWMIEPTGRTIGGCCLSLRLADYARLGQFALDGGEGIVPDGWFGEAGGQQVDFNGSGYGYGYQWWTYPGGNFGAQGIFGQAISIMPAEKIVAAAVGNWSTASSSDNRRKWLKLVQEIAEAE
ncbi:serine hydrolase [Altererythrobacter aquiaggeris]|uniref:serine hydrolase domain-containing protein n=1 Tax=Aestuarierythrobacter aquiaggeris TaxID=1898396 RepID=UPI003018FEA8